MISHMSALAPPQGFNVSAFAAEVNTTTANYNYLYSGTSPDGTSTGSSATFAANGSLNGSVEYGSPVFPSYIRTTSMVFCILIMCLGVIGNVMVPIVIFKTKDMRNSTNIFLVNLSIADLMVLLVCTPTVLVEVNSRPETWVLGREMCKAVPFVELTVAHASVLTILAISFERYYAICKPLKAGYICTKARASVICLLAWLIAAVFTSPILGIAEFKLVDYFDGSKEPACHTLANTLWSALYFLGSIFLFFIVPLVVLLVLYCIIAKNLIYNATSLVLNKHIDNYSIRARRQVILMLGTVVLSFFLCLIPFRVFTLWIIIVPEENVFNLGVERYYNILYFCRIMVYLNSAINPILYNLMSSKFRKGFLICSETRRRLFSRTTNSTFTSGQHSSTRSSTLRTSHESYRVSCRPKACSVLIKSSADSFESTGDASRRKLRSEGERVNVNIFTEKVIICHNNKNFAKNVEGKCVGENVHDLELGENFLKSNGKVDEETFV
ncbi:QRFP-like peptide receptor isoform X1 [Euwallacea fornicatus]|uniref:QRFP-like peptide receptor isoform X1 n=1 Tax=Euwallacea fornicatus TaxID=995702 RepID=UPI00338EC985